MKSPKWILLCLSLFGITMIVVTIVSFSRMSGNTGIDIAKMQQLREKITIAVP